MKTISFSEFRRLGREGMEAVQPTIITYDGLPIGVFASLEGVIVIADLHPRVQIQLRAQEQKARSGMPKPEKIFAIDIVSDKVE